MVSQIIFMREFLIVFYGNELSIGYILASWLIGGAIGSGLFGRFVDKIKLKVTAFSLCQIGLSLLLPLNIVAIRSIKTILNVSTGEVIPIFPMAISSFIILVPACAVLGFMFSLACGMYESSPRHPASRIGYVYVLEALGSMVGGILASFILIRILNAFQIFSILSASNLLSVLLLYFFSNEIEFRQFFIRTASLILITMIAAWPLKIWDDINKRSLRSQWAGYDLVESRNSIYGNIAVTRIGDEISFFDNGLHLYTIPDRERSEGAVHFALLEHADPKCVLLIGGGVGGLIEEIVKHPISKVDYVELDPLIVKMAEEYLPSAYYEPLKDARVSILNMDGRLFVKRTRNKYDCVIINLGDPYTAQLNRYYTVEFFEEVKRILKEGGILSFALSSSENFINKELADFLKSIYFSLKTVFEDVKIIPGGTAYFLAAAQPDMLTYDYKILVERILKRQLDIKYVREYYLFSKLSAQRVSYIENLIMRGGAFKINYDFQPVSYYYDIILWSIRFKDSLFSKILKVATDDRIWRIVSIIYVFTFLFGLAMVRHKIFYKKAVLAALMTTGFSEIALQLIVLLSFQIIYGYIFYKLGLMLTAYMVGLAGGAWWITKIMSKLRTDYSAFIWTQTAICIYSLTLPMFFWLLAHPRSEFISWVSANILFPSLPVAAGLIGGFQFPLASKIFLSGNDEGIGKAAGLNYGADLLGSCLGALLTAAFLIPILGIPNTCFVIAGMNFVILALLALYGILK